MATEPFTEPVSLGVKVTESVQLADLASEPPQGVAPLPAAAKLSLALMASIVIAPVPLLVTVMVFASLIAPRPVEEKC